MSAALARFARRAWQHLAHPDPETLRAVRNMGGGWL